MQAQSANILPPSSPLPLPSPVRPIADLCHIQQTPTALVTTTPVMTRYPPVTPLSNGKENVQPFLIDQSILKKCMINCRSRKNLAGRLALSLFTKEERITSNCRGVRGKKPLDPARLKAIKIACITEYRPKSTDNRALIMKEIRISVDEACRRVAVPRKQYTTVIGDDDDIFDITSEATTNSNWDDWESLDLLGSST